MAQAANIQRDICHLCEGFLLLGYDKDGERVMGWGHELRDSAKNGCAGCKLLDNIVRHLRGYNIGEDALVKEDVTLLLDEHSPSMSLNWDEENGDSVLGEHVDVFVEKEHQVVKGKWRNLPVRPRLHPNTKSDLKKVHQWIKSCHEGSQDSASPHSECGMIEHQELPKRVLRIDSDWIRLQETAQGKKGHYICLSYRWGKEQRFVTTRENLQNMKYGFRPECLPRTFRDAVFVARKLRIKYLWIDSLCIIQDDKEDWEIESSKMANIYQNAYLTISASKCETFEESLFATRKKEIQIPVQTSGGETFTVYVKPEIDHPDEGGSFGTEWPLMRRGWVFQEYLLSPRTLHFGSQELSWACRSALTCSCPSNRRGKFDFTVIPKTSYFGREVLQDPVTTWHTAIQTYSRLRLTYETDRLPALSGLAKAHAKLRYNNELLDARQYEYLAGLWRGSLIADLSWVEYSHKNAGLDSDKYIAPTWSWASCTWQSIDYRPHSDVSLCIILEVSCPPKGKDPNGQVAAGCYLKVKGKLIPGEKIFKLRTDSSRLPWNWVRSKIAGFGDTLTNSSFSSAKITSGLLHCCDTMCLPLSYDWEGCFLIVLTRVQSDEPIYERVGSLEFHNWGQESFSAFKKYVEPLLEEPKETVITIK